MRLIAWNCNMAFRKKASFILKENPDILIISESENLEKLKFEKDIILPNDSYWYGDNPHKGMGIYTYGDYTISKIEKHHSEFRYIVPLSIKNKDNEFILLAVWCQKPKSNDNYSIHLWKAIHFYTDLLKEEKVIIAGDFNSNSFWDKPNRESNHTNIVRKLNNKGIESMYHVFYNEKQGKEQRPTFYLYKNIDKPYHLDYCFASNFFSKKLRNVIVGSYQNWKKYSDHTPLIIDFED